MTNTFTFNEQEYEYCTNPYNNSALNERSIEVPIAMKLLEQYKEDCLEIGAVLPHYSDIEHTVIDLKERGEMVTNTDILDYYSDRKFKAAISISTLEHIGDGWRDSLRAIEHIIKLLEPNAPYIFTVPNGFNQLLDKAIRDGYAKVKNIYQFNKVDFMNHIWKQVEFKTAPLAYNGKSRWANTIYVLTNL